MMYMMGTSLRFLIVYIIYTVSFNNIWTNCNKISYFNVETPLGNYTPTESQNI